MSAATGGASSTAPPVNVAANVATLSPSAGACWSAVAPVCSEIRTPATGGMAAGPPGAPPVLWESHIRGCGLFSTTRPAPSTSANPPSGCAVRRPPLTSVANRSVRSAGCRAASGVLTTSTSVTDSGCARTSRSTPGSTSAYTAVSPCRAGAGSAVGNVNAIEVPAAPTVTSGVPPPADSARSIPAATGRTAPSGPARSVVSTFTHTPARSTRRTSVDCSSVKPPPGRANTC